MNLFYILCNKITLSLNKKYYIILTDISLDYLLYFFTANFKK